MEGDDSQSKNSRMQDGALAPWARGSAIFVGFLAVSVGATAIFKTDNEAGTVAIIGFGGVLSVLGILGVIPARGSFGNLSWEFAGRVIENLLRDDNPEVRVAVAEEIDRASKYSPVSTPPSITTEARSVSQSTSREYEQAVVEAIRRVSGDPKRLGRNVRTAEWMLDAVFGNPEKPEEAIGIEIKLRLSTDALHQILARAADVPFRKFMIVTPSASGIQLGALLYHNKKHNVQIDVVTWESPDDDGKLRAAIDRLLQL